MIFNTQPFGDYALLALRLILFTVFAIHGMGKLKNWKKAPKLMRFIGTCEIFGSLSMLLGFLTQLSGIGLGIIMLGAIDFKKFKWHVPFTEEKGTGWEFDLSLLFIAFALVILGSGAISLDALMGFWP